MSYEKLNLVNGEKFSAEHVSHIEDGIVQNALDAEAQINQIKGDLSGLSEGKLLFNYVNGLITLQGELRTDGYHYRVCTPKKYSFDHDIKLYVISGFKIIVCLFSDDGTVSSNIEVNSNDTIVINANTKFMITVRSIVAKWTRCCS